MDKYKPGYLGKVINPADDPKKTTDFLQNKYESFSTVYDAVKDESSNISDVSLLESSDNSSSVSIKIIASQETVDNISKKNNDNPAIKISGDVITATS